MQLTIGTSVIPLAPGISLPLVRTSPLFVTPEGKIPGSYIFNTSFPATEALRREFGQAHRVQRNGRATAELPYLITAGTLRFAGNCTVTQADGEQYEIAFKVDNGDFAVKLAGKTLKDLDLGGDRNISNDPYSIGTNSAITHYEHLATAPFTHEQYLVISSKILDINDNLAIGNAVFTASETGLYIFNASFNIYRFSTPIKLRVYKNSVLLEEIPILSSILDNRLNVLASSWNLAENDVLDFKWYFTSIPLNSDALIDITIDKDFMVDIHLQGALFNVLGEGGQDAYDYTVFPVMNNKFLDNFPDDAFQLDNLSIKTIYTNYFPVLNYWVNDEFPLFLSGTAEGESFICANLFTPFVYMKTLLGKIVSDAGFTIVNNPFDSVDFFGMVLFNAFAENSYIGDIASLVPVKQTFNLSDHVPAMAQNDFIKWVSILTGYMPVIDNNTFTITFVDVKNKHIITDTNPAIAFPGILLPSPKVTVTPEYKGIKFELKKAGPDQYLERIKELNDKLVYKGEVLHINNLPSTGNTVNDMYLVTALNEYYVYQYNPDVYALTWWFYSKKFPIVYTEGTEPYLQLTTELCPVLTSNILDETLGAPANRHWTIPYTEQAGILEGFPDSLGAEYGLQVLYYKGKSRDSLTNEYPLGTSRFADYTGYLDTFPDLNADSLFTNRYASFLRWLAYDTKPVTFRAILTAGQLKQLRFDQVYSGTGFNFLVKEIRINLEVDGLSMGEVDVYTC